MRSTIRFCIFTMHSSSALCPMYGNACLSNPLKHRLLIKQLQCHTRHKSRPTPMLLDIYSTRPLHQQVCHVSIQHIQLPPLLRRPLKHQMILLPFPVQRSHREHLTIILGLVHVNFEPCYEIHPLAEEGDLIPELFLETGVQLLRIDRIATSGRIHAAPVLGGGGGGRVASSALGSSRRRRSFRLFQPSFQRLNFALVLFSHGLR
mmetsp:Transcript_11266/g.24030  ORF Transcript_11266/g.24030 Transcript_11266/m.24030 type:complete len:205 (+) Transcript_11266:46-660(+)